MLPPQKDVISKYKFNLLRMLRIYLIKMDYCCGLSFFSIYQIFCSNKHMKLIIIVLPCKLVFFFLIKELRIKIFF